MSIRVSFVAVCVAAIVMIGCQNRQSLPAGPSSSDQIAAASTASVSTTGAAARVEAAKVDQGKTVMLMDACDPETFNAPPPAGVGPGTCSRQGGVRFASFIDELARHHSVGAWHMAPGEVTIKLGDVLSAVNHGGEAHTFTEVEEFGGGFVPQINQIGGFGDAIPECDPQAVHVLRPGESSRETTDEAGVEKYQCCIHPWMRTEVRIVQR